MKIFKYFFKLQFILAAFLLLVYSQKLLADTDVYSKIKMSTLSNGFDIVLSPNNKAKNVSLELKVYVGSYAETRKNLGASHLLEHLLFRNKNLKNNNSYNDLVIEKGGSINAETSSSYTRYYITIPKKEVFWAVDLLHKMINQLNFGDKELKTESKAILLELGEPETLSKFFGFSPFANWLLYFSSLQTFFGTEFAETYKQYPLDDEVLNTFKLTSKTIKKYYKEYYYPENMTLFVGGNFKSQDILKKIKNTFGKVKEYSGKKIQHPDLVYRKKPFIKIHSSSSTSSDMEIGAKLFKISILDYYVTEVFLSFLEKKYMRELRNKNGDTYSVNRSLGYGRGTGYATLSLETSRKRQNLIFNNIKSFIFDAHRQLSDVEINKAVKLYLKELQQAVTHDSFTMITIAKELYGNKHEFNSVMSPRQFASKITSKDFRASIKKIFSKDNAYLEKNIPYVFFNYEKYALNILSMLLFFSMFLSIFGKTTHSLDESVYIGKIKPSPSYLIQIIFIFFISFWMLDLVLAPLIYALFFFNFTRESLFFSSYVPEILEAFCDSFLAAAFLNTVPRKLFYKEGFFYKKSVLKSIKKINLINVQEMTLLEIFLTPKIWFSFKFRFLFFDLKLWKKGLLLVEGSGKKTFVSVYDSKKMFNKIQKNLYTKQTYSKAA